jgi:hypothetical protein
LSSLSDRIAELKRRAEQVASQKVALRDQRRSYSLAASEGDERARKHIADIDFNLVACERDEQTTLSGIEAAEALLKQQALDEVAKAARELSEKAYTAARAAASLNLELDLELVRLREMFERRYILLQELAATGERESAIANRLQAKSGPTAAAQFAGLNRFIATEMTPNSSVRELASANELLLTIGAKPNGGDPLSRVRPTSKPS